jgi:hypothetical protein
MTGMRAAKSRRAARVDRRDFTGDQKPLAGGISDWRGVRS